MARTAIQPAKFFVIGGTLERGATSYVQRPADDNLFRLMLEGEYCNVLAARQTGKSSLMVRTAERLKNEGVRPVIIDLTTIGNNVSADEWYFGLISYLNRDLKLNFDEQAWWYAQRGKSSVQRFSDFLYEVILKEIQDPIIIFIDEIDSTLKLGFTDDFFAAIRAAYNARSQNPDFKRLTFVLLGVARPADLIKDRTRTPYNIGAGIDITDFQIEELDVFEAVFEKTYPGQGRQILEWILEWTGGQPYLTQKLSFEVVKQANGSFSKDKLDNLVEQLFLGDKAPAETHLRSIRDQIRKNPHLAKMLRIYKDVLANKQVIAEERSIEQNELKLTGLVKVAQQGILQVHNRIYAYTFSESWVKKNTEINWRLLISYAVTLLTFTSFLYLSLTIYNDVQYIRNQPNISTVCFSRNPYPEKRLECLADLFQPDTKIIPYENSSMASGLFFQTSWIKQKSIFELKNPNPEDLEVVIKGLYANLAEVDSSDQNLKLLIMMQKALKDANLGSSNLGKEIELWLQARELISQENYSGALDKYDEAIKVNSENPATLFERARIYTQLGNYESALVDYEQVIAISPKLENETVEQPTSTPTSTFTATPTRMPTLTPTNTLTPTFTPTLYIGYTLTPVFGFTEIPTITPLPLVSETSIPTAHAEPTTDPIQNDIPVQSKFIGLFDRIDAVKNDINQNEALYSLLINTNPTNYPNLTEWVIFPATATSFAFTPTKSVLTSTVTLTPSPKPISDSLYYMIVLDASEKMQESFHGQKKWDVARNLLVEIINGLNPRAQYSLVVVGGSNSSGDIDPCANPISPALVFSPRQETYNYLGSLQSQGGGSFYRAYTLAKNQLDDLPKETIRTLIYITGSSDTCETENEGTALKNLISLPDSTFGIFSQIIILDDDGIRSQTLADQFNSLSNNNINAQAPQSISEIQTGGVTVVHIVNNVTNYVNNSIATIATNAPILTPTYTPTLRPGETIIVPPISLRTNTPTMGPTFTKTVTPSIVLSPTEVCPPPAHSFLVGPSYGGSVSINSPGHCSRGHTPESPIYTSGTYSNIPAGTVIWVLVYPPNGLYYPQSPNACAGAPQPNQGGEGWDVSTYLGLTGDPPKWFDIVVVLADQAASNYLTNWLNAGCSNNFPGIPPDELSQLNITEKVYITVQTE